MDQAKGSPTERPLSPHLQIYKWPVTMGTSILHRITGVGLAGGALLLTWWLIAVALGPEAYAQFQALAGHWFGRLVLFGFTLALVYHALNGIRHLAWDLGYGFRIPVANLTGIATYAMAVVVTVLIWGYAYWVKGDITL